MSFFKRYAVGKKAAAAAIGFAVQFLPFDDDTKQRITTVIVGYIVGQGFADAGKEKAKIDKGQ